MFRCRKQTWIGLHYIPGPRMSGWHSRIPLEATPNGYPLRETHMMLGPKRNCTVLWGVENASTISESETGYGHQRNSARICLLTLLFGFDCQPLQCAVVIHCSRTNYQCRLVDRARKRSRTSTSCQIALELVLNEGSPLDWVAPQANREACGTFNPLGM